MKLMQTILPGLRPRFEAGEPITLQEMQEAVGGYIEQLPLAGFAPGDSVLVFNEDGKGEGLPPNPAATAMVRHLLRVGDLIVGVALVCELEAADFE